MHRSWFGLVMLVAGCEGLGLNEVCYPGETGDGDACILLTSAEDITSTDYDYPPPLGDSIQYAAPTFFIDLAAVSGGTVIAPNFVLREVARQSNGQYAVAQTHAIERLQQIRDEVGVLTVNSGYRSPGHNSRIPNSATYSRHTYGDAFDLDPAEVSLDTLADACEDARASFVLAYTTHIHCDWREEPLDEAFYGDPQGVARSPDVTSTEYRVAPWAHDHGGALGEVDAAIELRGAALDAPAVGMPEGEPLRDWTAFDAAGRVVDTYRGATYEPPSGATRVEVLVGLRVRRSIEL